MPKYSMFELIDALATLIGTSLGIIVGCLIGLILSYAIYSSLDGHGARVELSILAFFPVLLFALS